MKAVFHHGMQLRIGEALCIESAEQTGPDWDTFKPVVTLKLRDGEVLVGWGLQGYAKFLKSIEIHADRGDGKGFVLLTIDTTALPATAQKWAYKAIYRDGEARVGQWSDETSITVAG